MKIKPQHVFSLAWMGTQVAWAAEGASASLDFSNSSLAPLLKNRFVFETGACFAVGTLVHTKDGLKPIEQIKVGDWVLSRPENPEHGTETAYKRVLRTMVHHDKPVIYGSFSPLPKPIPGNAYHTDEPSIDLIMTPDHPFWVQGVGWTAASLLREEYLNGRDTLFLNPKGETLLGRYDRQVLVTNDPSIGWVRGNGPFRPDCGGRVFDITTGQRLADADWDKFWDYQDENENPDEWDLNLNDPIDSKYIYKATVYNIEVEDWHTYFVGELGVWVHNANCDGLVAMQNARRFEEALPKGTPLYMSMSELNLAIRRGDQIKQGFVVPHKGTVAEDAASPK